MVFPVKWWLSNLLILEMSFSSLSFANSFFRWAWFSRSWAISHILVLFIPNGACCSYKSWVWSLKKITLILVTIATTSCTYKTSTLMEDTRYWDCTSMDRIEQSYLKNQVKPWKRKRKRSIYAVVLAGQCWVWWRLVKRIERQTGFDHGASWGR